MILRYLPSPKERLFVLLLSVVALIVVIYLYTYNLQEKRNVQSYGERCTSELASLKYQLNEVTDYKNRLDKLLTETQNAYEAHKERFKDMVESCVAMKQQSFLCQSQFEDLQRQCKIVRAEYNDIRKKFNL